MMHRRGDRYRPRNSLSGGLGGDSISIRCRRHQSTKGVVVARVEKWVGPSKGPPARAPGFRRQEWVTRSMHISHGVVDGRTRHFSTLGSSDAAYCRGRLCHLIRRADGSPGTVAEVEVYRHSDRQISIDELAAAAGRSDYIFAMHETIITKAVVAANPGLKGIVVGGSDYADMIDVAALDASGIPVLVHSEETQLLARLGNAKATADLTIAMRLCLAYRVVESDAYTRGGGFRQEMTTDLMGIGCPGNNGGVVGMGVVARQLVHGSAPSRWTSLHERSRLPFGEEDELGVSWPSLDDLLARSAYVCMLGELQQIGSHAHGGSAVPSHEADGLFHQHWSWPPGRRAGAHPRSAGWDDRRGWPGRVLERAASGARSLRAPRATADAKTSFSRHTTAGRPGSPDGAQTTYMAEAIVAAIGGSSNPDGRSAVSLVSLP